MDTSLRNLRGKTEGRRQMTGLGTLINTLSIIAGGMAGRLVGKLFKEEQQDAMVKVCGVSVLFISVAGAMEGMLRINGGAINSGRSMLLVLCIALGTMMGELINIERFFESLGSVLKNKTGNSKDTRFVDAFVTASLTVCIGAMAIVGSIQDGIRGDYSILAVKSVLDFIIIAILTSSMGVGAVFSAVPVLLFEGSVTVFAVLLGPLMTDLAIQYLSLVGAVLIFCVGVNLVWGKTVRVGNMLPALFLAVLAAYLPVGW